MKRLLPLIFSLLLGAAAGAGAVDEPIVLNDDCPPGFELTAGHCELRSLYQMYPSLQDAGVGVHEVDIPARSEPRRRSA